MITALESLVYGWGRSSWVIGMLPIHLGRTSSTSLSIAAIRRASTEGAMCLLTLITPLGVWEPFRVQGRFLPPPRRLGVWEPQVMEYGVQASWSLGVWGPSSDSRSRRNVGFWVEMGENIDVPTFERGVKKVLKAMLKEEDSLVHCIQGKHRSGSFLVFVTALVEDGVDVEVLINEYLQEDPILRPHDRGCVFRVWRESGLRPLLAAARRDPEVKHLVAEIHARLDESRGVKESRRQGVQAKQRPRASRGRGVEGSRSGQHGIKRPSEAQSQQAQKRAFLIPSSSASSSTAGPQEAGPQEPAGPARSQDVEVSAGPTVGNYRYKPGDWQCPECGNWNFSGRQWCNFNKCSQAFWKRGDWTCAACGNHNFASRTTCAMRRCQAPRP